MKLLPASTEFFIAQASMARCCGMERFDNPRVHDFFMTSVFRLFLRDWAARDEVDPISYDGKPTDGCREGHEDDSTRLRLFQKWTDRSWLWLAEQDPALVEVAFDWLWTSAREELPWTINVDDIGRPRKLMKLGSVAQLVGEARKWHLIRAQQERTAAFKLLGPDDEHFVVDLGVGYTLVRMLSPAALVQESVRMHHCIGWGSYNEKLDRPESFRFFSVRDDTGRPKATIECKLAPWIDLWRIAQFQGPHNTTPERHVADLVAGVMSELGFVTSEQAEALTKEHRSNAIRERIAARGEPPAQIPRPPVDYRENDGAIGIVGRLIGNGGRFR